MQYLRDNAGTLESSANGTTWTPIQMGVTAEIGNPVTMGPIQIRYNETGGILEVLDGGTWNQIYRVGYTELRDSYFVPPVIAQGSAPTIADPCLENDGSLVIWSDTTLSQTWLMYNEAGTLKKVELT
jgi:hypothetical protein